MYLCVCVCVCVELFRTCLSGMDTGIELDSLAIVRLSSLNAKVVGLVSYYGKTEFAPGVWVGLSLLPECRRFAKNDGSVNGTRYFNPPIDPDLNKPVVGNFAIFVKVENVEILSLNNLKKIDLDLKTKFDVLFDFFISYQNKIDDLKNDLEISKVELHVITSERNQLQSKFNTLLLDYNALSLTVNNDNSNSDNKDNNDLLLQNKKLELQLNFIQKLNIENEEKYKETIQSLKSDLLGLEKQITSNELNSSLLNDLNKSESIIEKITLQNSELLDMIDHLKTKTDQLEHELSLNTDLISDYEKANSELKVKIQELESALHSKDTEIDYIKANIEKLNKNKLIGERKQEQQHLNDKTNMFDGLYKNIWASFSFAANDSYSYMIDKVCNKSTGKWKYIIDLHRLKYSSEVVLKYCIDDYLSELSRWSSLILKIDFLLNIIEYDNSNSLDKYHKFVIDINNLILHWIELDDEEHDGSLLLSSSLELPIDFNFFIENPDKIDSALINRELAIYFNKLVKPKSTIVSILEKYRISKQGLNCKTINSLQDFQKLDELSLSPTNITKKTFWEIYQNEQMNNIRNLEDDLKLINDSKNEIIELQTQIENEKLKQLKINELESNIEQFKIEKKDASFKLKKSIIKEKEMEIKLNELKNIINKYGIKTNNNLFDEFEILEKSKLLNTINNQRNLITYLSKNGNDIQDIQLDNELYPTKKNIYKPCFSQSYYNRIDSLFDLCLTPISNSSNNQNYQTQKLAEYLLKN